MSDDRCTGCGTWLGTDCHSELLALREENERLKKQLAAWDAILKKREDPNEVHQRELESRNEMIQMLVRDGIELRARLAERDALLVLATGEGDGE